MFRFQTSRFWSDLDDDLSCDRRHAQPGDQVATRVKTPVLVSLGLPVFNGERYLSKAFESLLGQTHEHLELVVSDNCSQDSTSDICAEWVKRDGRVRYFRQSSNVGAPENWNFVARQAKGEFFKWASVSDRCAPEFVEVCLRSMQASDDIVLCFSRTRYLDDEDREIGLSDSDFEVLDPTPSDRFWRICQHLQINNAQAGLIRLAALRKTRLDRPYPHGDKVLMAELALLGKFVMVPDALLFRRAGREHWTAMRSSEDLAQMFWPNGAPALPMVHLRRSADFVVSAVRSPIALPERMKSAVLALRYAYWRQKDIKADVADVMRHLRLIR